MTATANYTFNPTTTKAAGMTATANVTGITPGYYDITVVSQHTVLNVKRNVEITTPVTEVNMGTLLEGNADDNIIIDITDFTIFASKFNLKPSVVPSAGAADFDCSNLVEITDFTIFAANYNEKSPIEVP